MAFVRTAGPRTSSQESTYSLTPQNDKEQFAINLISLIAKNSDVFHRIVRDRLGDRLPTVSANGPMYGSNVMELVSKAVPIDDLGPYQAAQIRAFGYTASVHRGSRLSRKQLIDVITAADVEVGRAVTAESGELTVASPLPAVRVYSLPPEVSYRESLLPGVLLQNLAPDSGSTPLDNWPLHQAMQLGIMVFDGAMS